MKKIDKWEIGAITIILALTMTTIVRLFLGIVSYLTLILAVLTILAIWWIGGIIYLKRQKAKR